MIDQKENDLMLNMSPIIKHQIDGEDDNRKFDHDNKYESCCIRSDKRALSFFTQAIFSGTIIAFCIGMLITNTECATFSRYSPLLTFVIGIWIPNPMMTKQS